MKQLERKRKRFELCLAIMAMKERVASLRLTDCSPYKANRLEANMNGYIEPYVCSMLLDEMKLFGVNNRLMGLACC